MADTKERVPPKVTGYITDYVDMELSPYEYISSDDAHTTHVINTEFIKDVFDIQLVGTRLDIAIERTNGIYPGWTNYVFCAIVEISLCMLANSGNDIHDVVDAVLTEQYIDRAITVRDLVSSPNDIDGTVLMYQLVACVYRELEKHIIALSSKTGHSDLIPISWSYPDYHYLAIGEFYD